MHDLCGQIMPMSRNRTPEYHVTSLDITEYYSPCIIYIYLVHVRMHHGGLEHALGGLLAVDGGVGAQAAAELL